jgi:3'-phosphoadenosine 5'-phosphosulfate sulfotransferase (PAPS reductase)/FAD synthetase
MYIVGVSTNNEVFVLDTFRKFEDCVKERDRLRERCKEYKWKFNPDEYNIYKVELEGRECYMSGYFLPFERCTLLSNITDIVV